MENDKKKTEKIEGEGSYTATHNYNAGVEKSEKEGRAEELAERAKQALDGPEGDALREAERMGKSGHPKKAP